MSENEYLWSHQTKAIILISTLDVIFNRPLMSWSEEFGKPFVFAILCVCISVNKVQVTDFDPATYFFENMSFWLGYKKNNSFWNFHFLRFMTFFNLSFSPFVFSSTYKHNFWHVHVSDQWPVFKKLAFFKISTCGFFLQIVGTEKGICFIYDTWR